YFQTFERLRIGCKCLYGFMGFTCHGFNVLKPVHDTFTGGRGKDGSPIITFPEFSSFNEVSDEDFVNVVTYLSSIPSIGFIIILDRRKDKWNSAITSLTRIAGSFPGNLQLVLVLKPSRLLQRAIADVSMRLHRDDFKLKVPVSMLLSVWTLNMSYQDDRQSSPYFKCKCFYAIENFALTVKSTAQMLQQFGTDLAETELPNDVQCTKDLLITHTENHDKLKVAHHFYETVVHVASKTESHILNPDEVENQTTVERCVKIFCQTKKLDETENAFEQFWSRHHLKLEQCLQLRHFEQDFRETLLGLSDTGDCVLYCVFRSVQESLEKAQLHAQHGDQLIQSNHYAVDSIRPKCVELRRICDDFSNEAKKKRDILTKSLEIHKRIDESGVYLLASQAVDRCQTQEGAEAALQDIEGYMNTAKEQQLSHLKDLSNQYEIVISELVKVQMKLITAEYICTQLNPKVYFYSLIKLHIMNELIETERLYVEELQSIIEGYAAALNDPELFYLIPPSLENKKEVLFGNLPEIYEFHQKTFLKELENSAEKPELVGTCFLKRKEELQIYEKYCQNKPRSEALWRQCGDSMFFQECQKRLDHKLSLDAYLLKPVQRITKYQLMLKEMLKCSKNSEGTAELEEALATMLDIIKSVNDSMHQIAITGFEGNLNDLGKLLMQGSFNVWTDHKKGHSKVKDLARFKPMQRHLFLYHKMLLFCKKREETSDGHEKSPSYSFKHSLKMSSVGITENVKGDIKKFEIWYNGREEVYIVQAPSMEVKNTWVSEIRKVLTSQLEACRGISVQTSPSHGLSLIKNFV
uniref:MCF.2 cell line derived transforming sequence-like 2 n=1 Tax=Sinocyclocheilus rhinocerous TaxID=307959 RepID=A0A673JKG2_9TELE